MNGPASFTTWKEIEDSWFLIEGDDRVVLFDRDEEPFDTLDATFTSYWRLNECVG
jgi:hypothetical protein